VTERPALDRWLAEADELVRGGDDYLADGMRCRPSGKEDLSEEDDARVARMNAMLRAGAGNRRTLATLSDEEIAGWIQRSWRRYARGRLAALHQAADCPKCAAPVDLFEAYCPHEETSGVGSELSLRYYSSPLRRFILYPCGHTVYWFPLRRAPSTVSIGPARIQALDYAGNPVGPPILIESAQLIQSEGNL
jgi:hypothetical protein